MGSTSQPTPPLPGLYAVSESGTLSVAAANGVLLNDTDPDTSNGLGVSAFSTLATAGIVTLPLDNSIVSGGLNGNYIELDEAVDLIGNRTTNSSNLYLPLEPFVAPGLSDFVLQRLGMTATGDASDVITPRVDFGTGTDVTQGDGTVTDRGGFTSTSVPPWQGLFNNLGLTADMDGEQVAAAWSGKIQITTAGTYTFTTRSDDGSVLFVNGQQIVNNNKSQGMTNRSGTIVLPAGNHDISIGYYQGTGSAGMQASYSGPDTGNVRVIIPPAVLLNDVAASGSFVTGGLRGNYYDTNNSANNGGFNFSVDEWLLNPSDPTDNTPFESLRTNATQDTTVIDFGVGTEFASGDGSVLDRGATSGNLFGGVGIDLGTDQVGAIWEGYLLVPETANFRFTARSDDNSQIYVDINNDGDFDDTNELVANRPCCGSTTGPTVTLTAGPHAIKVLFGEGGGGANVQAQWEQVSGSNPFGRQVIPSQFLGTVLAGDGSFNYDPNGQFEYLGAGETATDVFEYTARDTSGATSTATSSITITGENDAPVITSIVGNQTAMEGVPLSITDIITFIDIDLNDSHTVTVNWGDTTSSAATVTQDVAGAPPSTPDQLSADATHTYGDNGTYTVNVTVNDGTAIVTSTTFQVVVANVDPIANDDTGATDENTPLIVPPGTLNGASLDTSVLDNDTDVPADPLTVVELNGTAFTGSATDFTALGGSVTLNDDGSFVYDPTGSALLQSLGPGEVLNDTFTYTISDGDGGFDSATVTIAVSGDSTIEVDTNLWFVGPVAPPQPGNDGGAPDTVGLTLNAGSLEIWVNGQLLRSTPVTTAPITVLGSGDMDTITVDGLGSGGASLDGAGGSDNYVINLGDAPGGTIGGTISIADSGVGGIDSASITGGISADTFEIESDDSTADRVQRNGTETILFDDNLERLGVVGNHQAGQPGDTFQVTPDGTTTISIDGDDPTVAPGDQLVFNALGGTVTDTGSVLTAAGRQPVNYMEIERITLNNASLIVDGTGLDDTLTVSATGAADGSYVLNTNGVDGPTVSFVNLVGLTFNGNAGNDELVIHNPMAGGVLAPSNSIEYDGGGDTDALTLRGGSAASESYTAGPGGDEGQVVTGGQTLNFSGVEGPFTDTVSVAGLTVNATGGGSTFTLQDGPGAGLATLEINNRLSMDFQSKNALTVNADDQNDAMNVNLTDHATGLNLLTFNGGDGADTFDVLALPAAPGSLLSLQLNGNDGEDVFGAVGKIQPHEATPIFIDGGDPTVVVGDTLNLDMTGTTGPVVVDTVAGVANSASHADVNFANIETISLMDESGTIDNVDVGDLYVRTTDRHESITFTLWNNGGVKLRIYDFTTGENTFYPQYFGLVGGVQMLEQLLVYARGGDDYVVVAGHVKDSVGAPIPVEFHGEQGDDYLAGANADDLLVGGPGNDRLLAGEGNNVLIGDDISGEAPTDGDDRLSSRDGNDVLLGGGGDDYLVGAGGNDILDGGTGNDQLSGGFGDDILVGGAGDDTLQGYHGADVLLGGTGNDQAYGGYGNDLVVGGNGSDLLRGDYDDDTLVAGKTDVDDFSFNPLATAAIPPTHQANGLALLQLLSEWAGSGDASDLGTIVDDGLMDTLYDPSGNNMAEGIGANDRIYGRFM